jgi:2-succinyl-5-enolpyruvyl-6-hydroxy-3-cyclohexene-1-carboxylate synthase
MVHSDKETAQMLTRGLTAYGVSHVFSSPGSRNTPLILALARNPRINVTPIIDERQSAFIALGFALISRQPVALVCTSGTALLNYAPAIAEAYYRKIPLIVISADRPAIWINQDDSQTLRQPGALANIVKASYSLKGEISTDEEAWFVNRRLNEALQTALDQRPGPVHINISFAEPITIDSDSSRPCFKEDFSGDFVPATPLHYSFNRVDLVRPSEKLDTETAKQLAASVSGKRMLIVGGFSQPSGEVNKAFGKLTRMSNVVVVADALSNLNAPRIVSRPDLVIDAIANDADSQPQILLTFGGGLLSKKLKAYLRRTPFEEHWHIGDNQMLIDSYFSLTRRIEISEENFFPRFANAMAYIEQEFLSSESSAFKRTWLRLYSEALSGEATRLNEAQWSEKMAICKVLEELPTTWNLQLSNGLTPRYAVIGDAEKFHRRDCNRGVSGIDGSLSTALGASLAYNQPTVLLTGDMSLTYDISALASPLVSPLLKIVVINNHGGGIFRKIATTRNLPELEQYFACQQATTFDKVAEATGWEYLRADSPEALAKMLPEFIQCNSRPILLEIITPSNSQ